MCVCVSEREREKSPAKNEHTKETKHPRSVQKGGKEVGEKEHRMYESQLCGAPQRREQPP